MDRSCDTNGQAKRPFSSEQINWLINAVEHSIVPRLIQSVNISHPKHSLTENEAKTAVAEFVRLILENRDNQALLFVQGLEKRGASVQEIYLGVLAPVAKRLGELWEADDCDFTQVTLGMWRLHQVMHELSARFQTQLGLDRNTQTHIKHEAILIPVPGSQHTLGLLMVVEFFRREGWTVWGDPTVSLAEVVSTVERKHFHLIGVSVSTEDQVPMLKETIAQVRKNSLNPNIQVMVGGPLILAHPHLAEEVSAHGSAPDASEAVNVANKLVLMA